MPARQVWATLEQQRMRRLFAVLEPRQISFRHLEAGVGLSYTPWLRQLVNDIGLAYMSGYYRIGDYAAISAGIRYFSLGEVSTYDGSGGSGSAPTLTIRPYEMSADVAYSLMLSEKFSIAAGVRWIYSDLTYSYTDNTTPGSAFAADLGLYYQNYVNIGQRECQLGIGMNISNIGSKITMGEDANSEFIPTNLRLGASLMIPIDEYNRFTIAADANKLLVPLIHIKTRVNRPKITNAVFKKIITMCRLSVAYLRALATRQVDLRKN